MALEEGLDRMLLQNKDVFDDVHEPMPQPGSSSPDAAEEAASDSSPDDMTCAICLERTALTDIALVKGCEHQYCVYCILQWSLCKEWCPQCKKPFDYVLIHRQLDGTLTDYLTAESVVLLKRARWFEDFVRAREQAKITIAAGASSTSNRGYATADDDEAIDARDWADFYEDYVDAELEEDEEIEQYYFSSAAGRARVVLGNRRWGEGGYMRAGRMYARPIPHNARTPNAEGGKAATGKAAGKCRDPAEGKGKVSDSAGASSSSASAGGSANGASSRPSSSSQINSTIRQGLSLAAVSGPSSSTSSSRRGRTPVVSSVAGWLLDDDNNGFTFGGACAGSSSSRSKSRPDRPAGMAKPVRQLPKNQSAASDITCGPLVSPLGRSPGSISGFAVGSWGTSGSSPVAMGQSPGSAPGSGRRAKRNARRAAADFAGDAE